MADNLPKNHALIFIVGCTMLKEALNEHLKNLQDICEIHVISHIADPVTQKWVFDFLNNRYRQGVSASSIHFFLVTGWHAEQDHGEQLFLGSELPYRIYQETQTSVPPSCEIDLTDGTERAAVHDLVQALRRVDDFLYQEYRGLRFYLYKNGYSNPNPSA